MFEAEEMEGCHSCKYGENFDTEKEPCKYCYGLSMYTKKEAGNDNAKGGEDERRKLQLYL